MKFFSTIKGLTFIFQALFIVVIVIQKSENIDGICRPDELSYYQSDSMIVEFTATRFCHQILQVGLFSTGIFKYLKIDIEKSLTTDYPGSFFDNHMNPPVASHSKIYGSNIMSVAYIYRIYIVW